MRKTIAKITHSGVVLPALELLEILGKKGLKIALMKMTVKEVPAAGRQAFMALKELRAYILNDAEKTITITRPMADYFLNNVSVPDGLPLFTEIINDIREPDKVEFEGGGIELYDYQQTALDYILEAFNKGPFAGAFYLQMDTGLGKTRLGVGVIETLSVKTLIIVPTKAIAAQWVAELKPLNPALVYTPTLGDAYKKSLIVIATIATAYKQTPEFMNEFGLIVIDETHEYSSTCYKDILWLAQTRYVLGLSATPAEKADKLDTFINKFLGDPISAASIPGCSVGDVKFTGQVTAIKYYGTDGFCESVASSAGTMSAICTILNVVKDPRRLTLVAETVAELMKSHCVMVFAELRDVLPELRDALLNVMPEDALYVPEILRGGSNEQDMARAKRARVVLTTYGYSRRGVSITDMTALVLATPRKSGLTQIIGRILRRGSDESITRQIVDIIDMKNGLKSQFTERKKIYAVKGYPITTISVKAADS
jgi:superfamily II DNA or RNA helicase